MPGSQQILGPMCRQNPEPVSFTPGYMTADGADGYMTADGTKMWGSFTRHLPERLHTYPLGHIPNSNGSVFRVGNHQLLLGVEQTTRYIVRMSPECVHLPRFSLTHPPKLHLPIVGGARKQRQGRMKRRPIHTPIMSLQHILDHHVVRTKQFRLNIHRRRSRCALPRIHHGGSPRRFSQLLLSQPRSIPYPHRLIQGGTDNQILRWMKRRTHDIMIMPRQNTQTGPLTKIPQPQRLIVTRTQNPGELTGIGMKLNGANVVQMSQECEETTAEFVIPHLDFVVVSARDYEGVVEVKVHAADGAVVFFEAVDDGAYAVVPSVWVYL